MSMSDDVARFLDLEQRATDLTVELEKLRQETLHYSEAANGLNAAMNQLEPVLASLAELVEKSRDVIETLHTIGTAELLAATGGVQSEICEFRKEVAARLEQIEEYQQRSWFSKLFGGG